MFSYGVENSVMKFFDHEGNSMMSGITILNGTKVDIVKRKNLQELDWPFEFHVHTPSRLWKFRTRSIAQQNKWVKKLQKMFLCNHQQLDMFFFKEMWSISAILQTNRSLS